MRYREVAKKIGLDVVLPRLAELRAILQSWTVFKMLWMT